LLFIYAHLLFHWFQEQAAPTGTYLSSPAGQVSAQVILATVISKVIQVMENSKASWLGWISPAKPVIAKIVSAVSAFAIASGVVFTHTGSFTSSAGISFTIAGLSLPGLINTLSTFLTQWGAQHVFYSAIWRKVTPPVLVVPAPAGTGGVPVPTASSAAAADKK
jgi:hypothetical protein